MTDRESGDAGAVSAASGGVPDELAPEGGSPAQGNVDGDEGVDAVDGVLSPGSSATGAPTDHAG